MGEAVPARSLLDGFGLYFSKRRAVRCNNVIREKQQGSGHSRSRELPRE